MRPSDLFGGEILEYVQKMMRFMQSLGSYHSTVSKQCLSLCFQADVLFSCKVLKFGTNVCQPRGFCRLGSISLPLHGVPGYTEQIRSSRPVEFWIRRSARLRAKGFRSAGRGSDRSRSVRVWSFCGLPAKSISSTCPDTLTYTRVYRRVCQLQGGKVALQFCG